MKDHFLTPKERSPWKKESNKYKSRISLIETENKFKLMETESREILNIPKVSTKSDQKA